MSKKTTMDDLARELSLSKTTVSKAINHCPGIDPETKSRVMRAACERGYRPRPHEARMGLILPSVPRWFWGELRAELGDRAREAGIACASYVYSDMNSEVDAEACITRAIEDGLSVLILAVPDSAGIRRRLEEIAHRKLVLLIEEFLPVKNTFFIGEDSFTEGRRLARAYCEAHPEKREFAILQATELHTERMRIEGFCKTLGELGRDCFLLPPPASESHAKGAAIARELSRLPSLPDCIVCPSGNLTSVSLAVKKLRAASHIDCIGFDTKTGSEVSFAKGTTVLLQDLAGQARCAIACASDFLCHERFPAQKMLCIENRLYRA